jgi:hypothetical protein
MEKLILEVVFAQLSTNKNYPSRKALFKHPMKSRHDLGTGCPIGPSPFYLEQGFLFYCIWAGGGGGGGG